MNKVMKKIVLAIISMCLTVILHGQQDTINKLLNGSMMFAKQKVQDNYYIPKDTVKLFLEDQQFYIQKDVGQILNDFNNRIGYFKYFISTGGMEFELKKGLADGYYCLYNFSKKDTNKINNKSKYLVAAGEYKNGMKQGMFIFNSYLENPQWHGSYKEILFKNDTINGVVKEYEGSVLIYAIEYKMGKKDGFCMFWNNGAPAIILFRNDELIEQTQF
jgi:hypothetical protein